MSRKHILILLVGLLGFFSLIAGYSYQSIKERKQVMEQEQSMMDDKDAVENPQKLMNKVLGKKLFVENCSTCHGTKRRKHFVIDRRLELWGDDFFRLFVTKEDSLVENNDAWTIAINESIHGPDYAHNFNFSKSEMEQIFAYLRRD